MREGGEDGSMAARKASVNKGNEVGALSTVSGLRKSSSEVDGAPGAEGRAVSG